MRRGPWNDVGPTGPVAGRFGHATWMIGALVGPSDDRDLDEAVRLACLEDSFLNYRLLAELLIGGPKGSRLRTRRSSGHGASRADPAGRAREGTQLRVWHVAHIGNPTEEPPVDISPEPCGQRLSCSWTPWRSSSQRYLPRVMTLKPCAQSGQREASAREPVSGSAGLPCATPEPGSGFTWRD